MTVTTDTPRILATVRDALGHADPTDPLIVALRAVIQLADPASGANTGAEPAPPPRSNLVSSAVAARACGLTKAAMHKRLRRLGIGQKIVGRWYVDTEVLRATFPEARD